MKVCITHKLLSHAMEQMREESYNPITFKQFLEDVREKSAIDQTINMSREKIIREKAHSLENIVNEKDWRNPHIYMLGNRKPYHSLKSGVCPQTVNLFLTSNNVRSRLSIVKPQPRVSDAVANSFCPKGVPNVKEIVKDLKGLKNILRPTQYTFPRQFQLRAQSQHTCVTVFSCKWQQYLIPQCWTKMAVQVLAKLLFSRPWEQLSTNGNLVSQALVLQNCQNCLLWGALGALFSNIRAPQAYFQAFFALQLLFHFSLNTYRYLQAQLSRVPPELSCFNSQYKLSLAIIMNLKCGTTPLKIYQKALLGISKQYRIDTIEKEQQSAAVLSAIYLGLATNLNQASDKELYDMVKSEGRKLLSNYGFYNFQNWVYIPKASQEPKSISSLKFALKMSVRPVLIVDPMSLTKSFFQKVKFRKFKDLQPFKLILQLKAQAEQYRFRDPFL